MSRRHRPPADPHALPADQFARERRSLLEARHAQGVKARYLIVAVSLALGLADAVVDLVPAPWQLLLAFPGAIAAANGAAHLAARRGRVHRWHFWALLGVDTLLIAATVVALGGYGYVGLPFYLVAVGAHALGLPRAARVQLAAAALVYPAARLAGLALYAPRGRGEALGAVGLEAACLLGLGWLALQGPARFTYRVRRARRALGALERGEFDARLPTNALDDLGFLGLSFNHTAAALGDAMERLSRSEARFRSLVQQSSDVVLVLAPDTTVTYASPAAERVYGYAPDALVGRGASDLVHPDDLDAMTAAFAERLAAPGSVGRVAYRVRHADGSWRAVEAVGTNLLHDPAVGGVVFNTRDVTERTALEAELARRAFEDPLTGLGNRARFHDRAAHALARTDRSDAGVALLLLDLDDFKTVNDSLGHPAGDALLRRVADRLLAATRGCDTVARLGGDEFAVLLEGVRGDAEADVVAGRIIGAMERPFAVSDGAGGVAEVVVGASVGIARAEGGGCVDALLRDADAAMYRAKHGGKGRSALFAPAMHDAARARLALHADLRRALDGDPAAGELFVAYQPIVGMDDGRVTGVEALARWRHPRRGLVPPSEFVPVAEQTGLVGALGRFVLGEACRQGAAWAALGSRARVGVNLSARQLPTAAAEVGEALRASGLDAGRLTLEVTESTLVGDTEATLDTLEALKAMGVGLAIDDFGTGYSSLSYLQRFPMDVLKIDKSFVDRVAGQDRGAALARTIVALGDALGMYTVAEGVETEAQRAELLALGCRLGQGHLFARPMLADQVTALLAGPLPPVPGGAPWRPRVRSAPTPTSAATSDLGAARDRRRPHLGGDAGGLPRRGHRRRGGQRAGGPARGRPPTSRRRSAWRPTRPRRPRPRTPRRSPGTSARRWGTCSTSSSAHASRAPSAAARPRTSAAALPAARTASACGIARGSARRIAAVEVPKSGTATASATSACTASGANVQAGAPVSAGDGAGTPSTAPPRHAGPALSGCPSTVAQSAAVPRVPRPRPSSASASSAPAARAAAEEPSPRPTEMSDVAVIVRPRGTARPAASHARAKPRTSRSSPAGRSPSAARAPARATRGAGSPWVPNRASARSHRPSATPTQSNPAPRLLVEAGTRTAARAGAASGRLTARSRGAHVALTGRARAAVRPRRPRGRGRRPWRRSRRAGWPTRGASRRGGRRAARPGP
jgi:diguanylate cyclase (GGDEF)-like protein/PAS domain S-box-containing protein